MTHLSQARSWRGRGRRSFLQTVAYVDYSLVYWKAQEALGKPLKSKCTLLCLKFLQGNSRPDVRGWLSTPRTF